MAEPTIDELHAEIQRLRSVPTIPLPLKSKTTLYVVSAVALCALTAAFVIILSIVRPPPADNGALILPVTTVVGTVVAALIGLALKETAVAVDGKLTQFLILTAEANLAKGKLLGVEKNVATATETARGEGVAAGVEQERIRTEEHK